MKQGRVITLLLSILVAIAIGAVLFALRGVLLPFVGAVLLSYLFKPIVSWANRRNIPIVVSLIVVILVVIVILIGVGLTLYGTTIAFINALPRYEARIQAITNDLFTYVRHVGATWDVDVSEYFTRNPLDVATFADWLQSGFSSFLVVFGNGFIVVLFLLFILAGTGTLAPKIAAAFSSERAETLYQIARNIDIQIKQYLVTKALVSLLTGVIATVILLIIGVDFPFLWGFLTFLLNFIPNFGSIVATMFPVAISLLQFGTFLEPILVLVLLISNQSILGNFLEPRIVASSLNLSPLVVLFSLILWGWLWGVWGMVLAVPITSAVKIICENIAALHPVAVLMGGAIPKDVERQASSVERQSEVQESPV
ncbi:MAG TPA: AI-2E family transporter [Rhodothermales bacterium]|nr:AI-2E family transporter [Rhodothermales bacterium]